MKLREHKRILFFLKQIEKKLSLKDESITNELATHFTREEYIDAIQWLYNGTWKKASLKSKSDNELKALIGNDTSLLQYVIHTLESTLVVFPKAVQKEAEAFFNRTQNETHYLASKPVEEWDRYDMSNYTSLLYRTGTTKRVFGIFTSDVLAEDAHTVTTKPSFYFDTEEEAYREIEKIVSEGRLTRKELVVHSLWLLK